MSIFAALAATMALGVMAGWLSALPRIRRLRAETRALDQQLRIALHLTGHDRLTGLPNRSLAAKVFFLRETLGQPTIVALIDLDRFKHINDSYGHHCGDELLRTVAERLAPAAKARGGTAARLSGDEFLLLLPVQDGHHAEPVAEILEILANPIKLPTDDGPITVNLEASAGIAIYDGTYCTFNTMLCHADIALYHAKQQRGSHRTYHPDMRMPRNAGRHGPRRRDQRPTGTHGKDTGEAAR